MKIGIFTNIHKDSDFSVTKKLAMRLQEGGIEVLLYGDAAKNFNKPDAFLGKSVPEIMLTLGGDGTILRIISYCAENDIPILGLNLGNVGFLTGVELSGLDKLADILKNHRYTIEPCAMLQIKFPGHEVLALNDAVIARAAGRMISLDVRVNGEFVDNYYCDGFIIATPTGSTAYSLSAGGPIISPQADVFALTPVNPHTLHSRPIIVSGKDVIRIMLAGETIEGAVVVDGRDVGIFTKGQVAEICKSKKIARFIKTDDKSFFGRLLHKLNKWSVTEKTR